jgi:hypothetical protein
MSVVAMLGICMILLPPMAMLRVLHVAKGNMADDVTALLSDGPGEGTSHRGP